MKRDLDFGRDDLWSVAVKAELAAARRLCGKNTDRLFSIHHKTRLEQIEAALAALGRRLVVSVESA
jgi:hypothetical protein